ncbi:EF-hand calcium-binding domain-containing protein 8 [Rhynchocyon petersi]
MPSSFPGQITDYQQGSELLSDLKLSEMEKIFKEEVDVTGGLNVKSFIKAMKRVLSNVSDEVLAALFLKVDSDCSGSVTWQEYVDYLMREFQGKEEVRKSRYLHFQLPMRIIPLNHGCEIVTVKYLNHRMKKIGHFLTITKDGVLQFWTESFALLRSFRIQRPYSQQMWVIDMVCLYNMDLIAIASADQKLEFFDIGNHKCSRAFTLVELDSCVLVMDYWSDKHRAVFCYGDTKGNIFVFTSDNLTTGLFNPRILPRASKWDHWISVSIQKLLNEKSISHKSYRLKAVHCNWCQQVKVIHQMNTIASCAATEKSALVLSVLPSKPLDSLKSTVLNLRRGILCFDYFADRNFLVTGGYDPLICLWNPLFSRKPVWLLKGHQTSVTHVHVINKNSILISISKDKNIRVWDMQDYVCLQSFCGKLFALGNCPITSACVHKEDTLICSTYSIGILSGYLQYEGPEKLGETTTHRSPLCAVLYSKIFKQVVSGSLKGMVKVWDIMTGKNITRFSVVDASHMELTAMALDESERCLLTGLLDGSVKMWNYNSGECLRTFPNTDKFEISGIIHMNQVFYVTGWSKRVTYMRFHKTRPVLLCHHWQTYHTEDILCIAKYQNQFLGTSSYNGDILFWNVNWFKPILKFNATESPLPSQPKKPGGGTQFPQGPYSISGAAFSWVQVQSVDDYPSQNYRDSKPCMEEEKWAYKGSRQRAGSRSRAKRASAESSRKSNQSQKIVPLPKENEKRRESWKKIVSKSPSASVEKIIFLQTRSRRPRTAALLSSCIDGYIYAWSIHGNGGLLGKFPVALADEKDVIVGAMATDENDQILLTGDCKGYIKIWDIKNYCTSADSALSRSVRGNSILETENKFQLLIPKELQVNFSEYASWDEKEVVDGQTIFLTPPRILITWKGHLEGVADILYVDSFQLVISAGLDRNVKAWRVYGDAVGTFGLSVWSRLQDFQLDGDVEPDEKSVVLSATQKASHMELKEEQDLAEALAYQRREQVVLLDLLHGKKDKEAEAWAKLQKMASVSPWPRDYSPEDVENSWQNWESKDKQVSRVLGGAYKPKERIRSPELLSTDMQHACLRQQISPPIYQSLHFNELKPTEEPDFSTVFKTGDQPGQRIFTLPHYFKRGLEYSREPAMSGLSTSMPTVSISPSASSTSLKL